MTSKATITFAAPASARYSSTTTSTRKPFSPSSNKFSVQQESPTTPPQSEQKCPITSSNNPYSGHSTSSTSPTTPLGTQTSLLLVSPFAVPTLPSTIDHCPDPPSASALEDISLYTANAERCLQTAEKRKFTTMGNSTVTGNTMTREDVLHTLSTNAKLLQIWAICPYGGMGPMLRKFLFGDTTPFVHSLLLPTNPTPPKCTSNPSRAPLRMAFFLLQTHRGLPPNPPIRNSTATPTLRPPQESTSSNSSALPAPKRSPSTSGSGDQPVPSKPHGRPRAQPGPLLV